MFGVDFNDNSYSTIQIISYALEAGEIGMEPLLDLNNDGTINLLDIVELVNIILS